MILNHFFFFTSCFFYKLFFHELFFHKLSFSQVFFHNLYFSQVVFVCFTKFGFVFDGILDLIEVFLFLFVFSFELFIDVGPRYLDCVVYLVFFIRLSSIDSDSCYMWNNLSRASHPHTWLIFFLFLHRTWNTQQHGFR